MLCKRWIDPAASYLKGKYLRMARQSSSMERCGSIVKASQAWTVLQKLPDNLLVALRISGDYCRIENNHRVEDER